MLIKRLKIKNKNIINEQIAFALISDLRLIIDDLEHVLEGLIKEKAQLKKNKDEEQSNYSD